MKIAVATLDGVSVSQHFGQSKQFLVFDIDGNTVRSRESRTSEQTAHAQGLCNHDGEHHHGNHSHANVPELLSDCKFVLCGGMGAGAARSLRNSGIEPVVLAGEGAVEEVVLSFLNGTASSSSTGLCNCRH